MNIAIVSHDGRKKEMIEWVKYNYVTLSKHNIFATGTTGKLIKNIEVQLEGSKFKEVLKKIIDKTNLSYIIKPFSENVTCLLSGPLGGDQQIGAMIAEGKIDMLIFFCDNLIMQGHQNDVSALSRLASLYNIAFATNRTTADMLLTSSLFDNNKYNRVVPKCIEDYTNRVL